MTESQAGDRVSGWFLEAAPGALVPCGVVLGIEEGLELIPCGDHALSLHCRLLSRDL